MAQVSVPETLRFLDSPDEGRSMEDPEEDAELLLEYGDRLDDLLGEDWTRVMSPFPEPTEEE